MSDLETFFQHTDPRVVDAATSKYGDPGRDRALRELSPLHRIDRMRAPLLVVRAGHDTKPQTDPRIHRPLLHTD